MAQTLETTIEGVAAAGEHALTHEAPRRRGARGAERPLERFLSELERMTPRERIRASRYSFNRWERGVFAARYPEEVPLVNGELEWIAASLA